jgi:chemotaxis protein methyltransferase CheR
MDDPDCVAFLQWALPRLGMRWQGFRKVRRRVCKRIERRLRELGLRDPDAYREWLQAHPGEWSTLDSLCTVTISRFGRDRLVFAVLQEHVLPELASRSGGSVLRAWSAGCACGEEAYTLAILQELRPGQAELDVLGTDVDPIVLERARRGVYPPSSLRELAPAIRAVAFELDSGEYRLRTRFRKHVRFAQMDLRRTAPDGAFDLILCRNLAFTYFDRDAQFAVLRRLVERLAPSGALVIGAHETLPPNNLALEPWPLARGIFRPDSDARSPR